MTSGHRVLLILSLTINTLTLQKHNLLLAPVMLISSLLLLLQFLATEGLNPQRPQSRVNQRPQQRAKYSDFAGSSAKVVKVAR